MKTFTLCLSYERYNTTCDGIRKDERYGNTAGDQNKQSGKGK